MIILFQISGLKTVFLSEVSFMNVGQGDATFIYSQGKSMLIDTGGVRHFDMAKEVLIPYFKKLSIRVLDYLVITHPDFDHDGAMASLIASFPVKNVIQKPFHQINLGEYVVQNYQHFHPFLEEDNERSLVMDIQFQDCRWLIMGDATYATEALIQSQYPNLTANILRIGHHGSNTSTSREFLNQIKPKQAVISVGGGNRYGHPHQEVLARLEGLNIDIRRTDIEGTIRYQTCKI
jgi:competence protein ComEC